MRFAKQVVCETSGVSGMVNTRIPFSVKLTNLDELLVGKEARLELDINGLEASEQKRVNLYRVHDGERQKLLFGENHSATFSVEALTAETSYDFEFETDLLLNERRWISLCAMMREIGGCSVSGYGRCGNVLVKDPNQPVEVEISYNSFESEFQQTHTNNVGSISYRFSNLDINKDLVLQYIFKDYELFGEVLSVYQGEDYFFESEDGILAEIGPDGIWNVPVEAGRIEEQGYFTHYLMFFSDHPGEILYDIKVFDPGDFDLPIFEQKDNRLFFLEDLSGTISPHPIEGITGTYIPISFEMDVDSKLIGKEVAMNLRFWNLENVSPNDLKLYYERDGVREEITFDASWFASEFPVSRLRPATYKFILYSDVPISRDQGISLAFSPVVNNRYGYCQVEDVPITITGEVTGNENISRAGTVFWVSDRVLYLHADHYTVISVYTLKGQFIHEFSTKGGDSAIPLPRGVYILCMDGKTYQIHI